MTPDFLASWDVRVGGGESWNRVDIAPLEVRRPEVASGYLSIDIDQDTLSLDCTFSFDMNKRTWLGRLVQRLFSPISGLFGVRASGRFDSPS